MHKYATLIKIPNIPRAIHSAFLIYFASREKIEKTYYTYYYYACIFGICIDMHNL